MRKHALTSALFLLASGAFAQTTITQYRSGIDITLSGTRGVDWEREELYYDAVIDDRAITYIRTGTTIALSHNARNVGPNDDGTDSYETVATNVGTIKYKVDGDWRWDFYVPEWPSYSGAFSFADLNYGAYGASGTPVVGTTGLVGTLSLANKTSTYYRGILDEFGDEWHTITVADDDSWNTQGDEEFDASDSKVHLFCVAPKTPCLRWTVIGAGQFYTTPHKKYFVPVIYSDATTYIAAGTGTVSVVIRDINGGNISYRINGGSTVDVGASSVTLDQDDFSAGSNALEYWITSTPAIVKTRTVVKDPAYPSASETHGDRFWASAAQFTSEVKPRVEGDADGTWWLNAWRTNNTWNLRTRIESISRAGLRNSGAWMASPNAIVARWDGMTAKQAAQTYTYADYARLALFESPLVLDPVGRELNASNQPLPVRELIYRGYYDVEAAFDAAIAYDILVGYYRSSQGYANGITAIQDYWLRDMLASWVHLTMLEMANYRAIEWDDPNTGGMWDTAQRIGAFVIMCVMPSYSTPYYGTSGLDGSTTTDVYNPFRDVAHTWKELFVDNNVTQGGFPNVDQRFGVEEYLFASDGKWVDRIGYTSSATCGHPLYTFWNMAKMWAPSVAMTRASLAQSAAASGALYGLKINEPSDANPVFRSWAGLQNSFFTDFRAVAQPTMLALPSSSAESKGKQFQQSPLAVLWYDHELTTEITDTVATPTFSTTQPGTYQTTQSVALACTTSGATINYRLNGGAWQTYTTALSVSATTLIEAYGSKAGSTNSGTLSGTFRIAVAPVTMSPDGGTYAAAQTVTLATATSAATILYSIDGSTPSITYSSPLLLGTSATIRAFGRKSGLDDSIETSATYQITTGTSESEWTEVAAGPYAANLVIEATVSVGALNANFTIGCGDVADVDFWDDLACIVRWSSGTIIDVRNGGAYAADTPITYAANTEYRTRIVIDLTAKTYDVFINDTQIADDYAFRTEQNTISEVSVIAWRAFDPETPVTITGLIHYLQTPPVRARNSPRGGVMMLP